LGVAENLGGDLETAGVQNGNMAYAFEKDKNFLGIAVEEKGSKKGKIL